jgi:hypothetical protein
MALAGMNLKVLRQPLYGSGVIFNFSGSVNYYLLMEGDSDINIAPIIAHFLRPGATQCLNFHKHFRDKRENAGTRKIFSGLIPYSG